MIKDGMGNEIQIGDQVLCGIGNQMFVGRVRDIKEGGMSILNELRSRAPAPVRADHIVLVLDVEVDLMDAAPGKEHKALYRIVDPTKERISTKGD